MGRRRLASEDHRHLVGVEVVSVHAEADVGLVDDTADPDGSFRCAARWHLFGHLGGRPYLL